jgi:hypothetical protein
MDPNQTNPNWQDKLLGGAILTGLIMVAVIAVLFTAMTWIADRHAASSAFVVGLSHHASPAPHFKN